MHTLFTLEDLYGLTVSEADEEICLKVDTSKGKEAHELLKMLYIWKEQADKLSSGEISKDEYIAQPPFIYSPTPKPLDYKNNGSHATVIKLLSKDF